MSRRVPLPTDHDIVVARDQLVADADGGSTSHGRRTRRRLGLTNTTFWRHYPAIARELTDTTRRTSDTRSDAGSAGADQAVARIATLARDNQSLREHLDPRCCQHRPTHPREPPTPGSPRSRLRRRRHPLLGRGCTRCS